MWIQAKTVRKSLKRLPISHLYQRRQKQNIVLQLFRKMQTVTTGHAIKVPEPCLSQHTALGGHQVLWKGFRVQQQDRRVSLPQPGHDIQETEEKRQGHLTVRQGSLVPKTPGPVQHLHWARHMLQINRPSIKLNQWFSQGPIDPQRRPLR